MTAFAMKPTFTDKASYLEWRKSWAFLWNNQRDTYRSIRQSLKTASDEERPAIQRRLAKVRVMGHKLMSLLQDAKERRDSILKAKLELDEQNARFPITIENARNIVFHFNKKSLEFTFLPAWVIKAKGETYYLKHITCNAPWTTKESPDHPSTKGAIQIRRGTIHIDSNGEAVIESL